MEKREMFWLIKVVPFSNMHQDFIGSYNGTIKNLTHPVYRKKNTTIILNIPLPVVHPFYGAQKMIPKFIFNITAVILG